MTSFLTRSVAAAALGFLRFFWRPRQGAYRHFVPAVSQMADHVERSNLSAAFGWKRESVTDIQNFHAT